MKFDSVRIWWIAIIVDNMIVDIESGCINPNAIGLREMREMQVDALEIEKLHEPIGLRGMT